MDIAAIHRQATVAVNADEHTGTGDLGRIVGDGTILEGGERRFDLADALIDLVGIFLGLGVFSFQRRVFRREGIDRRLSLIGQRRGRTDQPAQTVTVAIGRLDPGIDPLPALGADRLGFRLQPVLRELIEQADILQPAAIVGLEQVVQNGAAGRLIGGETDELRPLVGSAHGGLCQHPPDLMGFFRPRILDRVPDLLLARMVGIDGEGHELSSVTASSA